MPIFNSDWIRDIDKHVFDIELLGQMLAHRLDAETLGGVMAGREERHAAFRRRMHY